MCATKLFTFFIAVGLKNKQLLCTANTVMYRSGADPDPDLHGFAKFSESRIRISTKVKCRELLKAHNGAIEVHPGAMEGLGIPFGKGPDPLKKPGTGSASQ
jgi:hypothetical protein